MGNWRIQGWCTEKQTGTGLPVWCTQRGQESQCHIVLLILKQIRWNNSGGISGEKVAQDYAADQCQSWEMIPETSNPQSITTKPLKIRGTPTSLCLFYYPQGLGLCIYLFTKHGGMTNRMRNMECARKLIKSFSYLQSVMTSVSPIHFSSWKQ